MSKRPWAILAAAVVLLGGAVASHADPADEREQEQERLLLDILRSAPPAPNPPAKKTFSALE